MRGRGAQSDEGATGSILLVQHVRVRIKNYDEIYNEHRYKTSKYPVLVLTAHTRIEGPQVRLEATLTVCTSKNDEICL